MVFHVTSFFVFGTKFDFVTHLSPILTRENIFIRRAA